MFLVLWIFSSGSAYCGCHFSIHVDRLALEVRGQSYRTITIRGTVLGRLPPPNTRHSYRQQKKHPNLLEKEVYLLILEFGLRVRLLVWHIKAQRNGIFLLYQ